MSHISNTINELLTSGKITATELARDSGLPTSLISRIRSGVQIWVSPTNLNALAEGFAKHMLGEQFQVIHARLLCARLRDESVGPGAKIILIEIRSDTAKTKASCVSLRHSPVLPPRMQQNLDMIADHGAQNRHVRDFVEITANLCRTAIASQAPANIYANRHNQPVPGHRLGTGCSPPKNLLLQPTRKSGRIAVI